MKKKSKGKEILKFDYIPEGTLNLYGKGLGWKVNCDFGLTIGNIVYSISIRDKFNLI